MRVLVCGGREYADRSAMRAELAVWMLSSRYGDLRWRLRDSRDAGLLTIVHGGARGADTLAGEVAQELGYTVEVHPADWKTHGRAAGPTRNQKMLDTGVDLVMAFPGGRGTADMVKRATVARVPVRHVASTWELENLVG